MSISINISGKIFSDGIKLGNNNEVVSVDSTRFPSLANVSKGMVVRSINGVAVSMARDEQKRHCDSSAPLAVGFTTPAKDEFDLSSDEDVVNERFQPATSLPPLPPEYNNTYAKNSAEVVLEAAKKCSGGRCVIIMLEGANPTLPITLAAVHAQIDVMYIDTVARMKTRQRMEEAGNVIKKSLEKGLWIYVEQATKSISLLQKLEECLKELEAQKKIHPKSCVFLMCEPHPHFPEALLKKSVTLRCCLQSENIAEVNLKEDVMESKKRLKLIHGEDSVTDDNAKAQAPQSYPQDLPEVKTAKKKVRISSEVNIISLEKSTFLEMSASPHMALNRSAATREGLNLVAKYTFGSNEKFISLCKVQNHRFAVGTGSGYVVLLDGDGLPLIQFRPRKACVWDISFATQFDFATACDDGTSTIFNYSLVGHELMATSVASFQSDVFAVTYAKENDVNSPVLSGGLSATICVLHSDRQNSSFITSGTSIQAMCATRQGHVIVGGGNGVCSLIDPTYCFILEFINKHSKKVPAVSSFEDVAITGGFDRVMRMWDIRNSFRQIYETILPGVVTAVAVNQKYAAVCSGPDLFVWDMRQLASPLSVKKNAWKDLTRGLVIDDSVVVTASVDGVTRFWEIH
ncbi:unnamed protein product [Phytomonas sp. EM1]|nr:unnamed protein product [Phytomonas sp. EM1]|eukprot:CCW61511.1 unnamed protein product [Phytomonas sp. isolate EM1]